MAYPLKLFTTDQQAYDTCHPADRWVFNKLLLAESLGYLCGPAGTAPPVAGEYIIRPIMNLTGMGSGAKVIHLTGDVDQDELVVPPGFFWCEFFKGPHLSVDYQNGLPRAAMEALRDEGEPLWKIAEWRQTKARLPWPRVYLEGSYEWTNVEFVAGQAIEVHLRANPDLRHGAKTLIPVWDSDQTCPLLWYFQSDPAPVVSEGRHRWGFYVPSCD